MRRCTLIFGLQPLFFFNFFWFFSPQLCTSYRGRCRWHFFLLVFVGSTFLCCGPLVCCIVKSRCVNIVKLGHCWALIGSQPLQCLLFLKFSLSCQNKNKLKSWIALVPLSWHLYFSSNGFGRLSNQQMLSLNPATYSLFLLY